MGLHTMQQQQQQQQQQQLPMVNLSGLNPSQPHSSDWDAARTAVFQALEKFGCFQAVYDRITPELKGLIFREAMEDVFSLPLETKMGNNPKFPLGGFIGNLPDMTFESLRVDEAPALDAAERFTHLMWPEGNPKFCNIVWSFAKKLQQLERMVMRMILQSMGVEKHMDSFTVESNCGLRLSKYWISPDQCVKSGMGSHTDVSFLTIVCQHEVQGLEVQTTEDSWITVMPLPNTYTVMLGDALEAWTNGRLKAPVHRGDNYKQGDKILCPFWVSTKGWGLCANPGGVGG
ncbi:probable inactive 2-oxoglutarate-dependent dioxygenase AOP2 [Dioscorea cayenensis subsp. rotundata]|uniref:Probable inactive 2-oxoglutarate-dependent dioxygenase AOP2 n=1 Tax=Dioscorea cayennensis subsp. rotundata TaxID=55577 RepID=A0AB40D0C4_DIOCR|nr:probable inactive 2-oxoglutarate-dependent dioxygenase AOP2 [Dioscorea cayenensis subsp. rotundata]